MGMTIIEKTLAAASEIEEVEPGDIVYPKYALATGSEFSIPAAHDFLSAIGTESLASPGRVSVVFDRFHLQQVQSQQTAAATTEKFIRKYHPAHVFRPGRSGVGYYQNSEAGLVVPGDVVIAGDSHAAAYGALGAFGFPVGGTDLAVALTLGQIWLRVPRSIKVEFTGIPNQFLTGRDLGLLVMRALDRINLQGCAVEFHGEPVKRLEMNDRFLLADAAFECGAVTGILPANDKVIDFLAGETTREAQYHFADDDAEYEQTIEINLDDAEPLVRELTPGIKIYAASAIEKDIPIRQVIIGGCGGGALADLWLAAKVMKYRKVHETTRLLIIPASAGVYQQMLSEGLASIFVELGASIQGPTCGPCPDAQIVASLPEENAVVTSRGYDNGRNSRVWSAGVVVAATAAVSGKLTDPFSVIKQNFEETEPMEDY